MLACPPKMKMNPMITLDAITELAAQAQQRRRPVWDALWAKKPIGRLALAVRPSEESLGRARQACAGLELAEPSERPAKWTAKWRQALLDGLHSVYAGAQMPGDGFLGVAVPRFVHGQSQGICDIFGARVEEQPDGYLYVHPLPADPAVIDDIEPRPIQESMYWGAVEWLRYARAATEGKLAFRMPVMTGPLDTANYLLGSTTLFEWVHTHPDTVHRLMDKIARVEVAFIRALQSAVGGVIHSHHLTCTWGGYELCSECRSIVSAKCYEEFEAPRLKLMGEPLGPYGIHACGSWERTVPSALADPNLRVMNGQVKENDLSQLCRLAAGKVTFSIGASSSLDEKYLFPDRESFFAYMLDTVPPSQPLELSLSETEIPLWNHLCNRERQRFGCNSFGRLGT